MIRDSRKSMRVAFRVDASVEIGTGHVMRCLTLADALAGDGAACLFLCRAHDGHLLELIAARGHEAVALPARDAATVSVSDPPLPAHARWLGTDWATDAEDSRAALAGASIDWLIADHYALDRHWERAMRPACRRLLAIDDLADRPHDCDLLLDQNLGRSAEDYGGLLAPGTRTLIGPRYALLRPEFAALRAESLARRAHPQLRHLLVTMGGVDKNDATGAVLDALDGCDLPPDLSITVVLGPHAPWLAAVKARAAAMPRPTRVLVGISDMARLMLEADLAIGAAGTTSWERCCLGLPTIQLVVAENQKEVAANLELSGAAVTTLERTRLCETLPRLLGEMTVGRLQLLARRAADICDGEGATRVHLALSAAGMTIRHADSGDVKRIWKWRHGGDAARFYKKTAVPTYSDHRTWFSKAFEDKNKVLLIVCQNDEPVAHVRFDRQPDNPEMAVIGIYVSPSMRGKGIAGPSLRLALQVAARENIGRIVAEVHRDNLVSRRLFERYNFTFSENNGNFSKYFLNLPPELKRDLL